MAKKKSDTQFSKLEIIRPQILQWIDDQPEIKGFDIEDQVQDIATSLVRGFDLDLSIAIEFMIRINIEKITPQRDLSELKTHLQNALIEKGPKGYLIEKETFSDSVFIRISKAMDSRFLLRKNIVKGHIEYKDKTNDQPWLVLDDYRANSMFKFCYDHILKNSGTISRFSKAIFELYIDSDETPRVDPFKDFFSNLPAWDQKDYISDLASCVICSNTDQQLQFQTYLKKWLIACVAQALGKAANHTALVFAGAQNVGKTTFFENLCFDQNYIHTGAINANDKDDKFLLTEMLFINLDELEGSTRGEISHLKSLMTTKSFNLRRHYGRRKEFLRRTASFCGSINDTSFLTDSTGSRRWLVVEVAAIDLVSQKKISLPGLWAQALHLLKSGEKYWFDKQESDQVNLFNQQFELERPEEILLLNYFEPGTNRKDPTIQRLTTTEIKLAIEKKQEQIKNLSIKVLGIALRKHGFPKVRARVNGDSRQVYLVIPRGAYDVANGVNAEQLELENGDLPGEIPY